MALRITSSPLTPPAGVETAEDAEAVAAAARAAAAAAAAADAYKLASRALEAAHQTLRNVADYQTLRSWEPRHVAQLAHAVGAAKQRGNGLPLDVLVQHLGPNAELLGAAINKLKVGAHPEPAWRAGRVDASAAHVDTFLPTLCAVAELVLARVGTAEGRHAYAAAAEEAAAAAALPRLCAAVADAHLVQIPIGKGAVDFTTSMHASIE